MKTKFINKIINYTGKQLCSGWISRNFKISPPCIVSFIGKCDISSKYMVDLEDLKNNCKIYSEKMLHFIIEESSVDLEKAILKQQLFLAIISEELNRFFPKEKKIRKISNVYDGNKKITISVATLSPVSSLIHIGINIKSKNTPVPTKGLEDYKISPIKFGKVLLKKFIDECEEIEKDKNKVRKVK